MEAMDNEKEKAAKCLVQLKNYLKDDELNYPLHDDNFLLMFVRAKKYDAESAYQTVKKYFALRCSHPKLFNMCFPNHEVVSLVARIKVLLKDKDSLGRPVLVVNSGDWDISKFNVDHIIVSVAMVLEETLLTSMEAQLNGIVLLMNFDTLGLRHVAQWTPTRIKYLVSLFQGCFPLRYKAIHIVNQPKIFDLVMMAARPLMTAKLQQRLIFHGKNFDQLHKTIPPESLSEEYGGYVKGDEAFNMEFNRHLMSRDDYFKEKQNYGYQKRR